MIVVGPLRAFAGDLATIGRAIGATATRARQTFREVPPSEVGTCEVPGCGAPATHPCICEATYCERHYAEVVS